MDILLLTCALECILYSDLVILCLIHIEVCIGVVGEIGFATRAIHLRHLSLQQVVLGLDLFDSFKARSLSLFDCSSGVGSLVF
jgi:hypothetical protein